MDFGHEIDDFGRQNRSFFVKITLTFRFWIKCYENNFQLDLRKFDWTKNDKLKLNLVQ